MSYDPITGGPRNLRELYHWVWQNLKGVGSSIGDEGGGGDPGHQHQHDNLLGRDLNSNHAPFTGVGTSGFVPNPGSESHRALSDKGEWRPASRVFFQSTQPTEMESATGDFWMVTL